MEIDLEMLIFIIEGLVDFLMGATLHGMLVEYSIRLKSCISGDSALNILDLSSIRNTGTSFL